METLSFNFIIPPLAAHRHICHSAAAITDPNEDGAASTQLRRNHKHVYGLLRGGVSEHRFNSRWLFTGTSPECSSGVSDAPTLHTQAATGASQLWDGPTCRTYVHVWLHSSLNSSLQVATSGAHFSQICTNTLEQQDKNEKQKRLDRVG